MAPVAPLGRQGAIELVKKGSFPIMFGSPHPCVSVVVQEGRFRIRELVVDRVGAEVAAESARRSRSPSWMPEHYYSIGQPTGTIFADAASAAELVELMATMPWADHW